MTVSLPRQANYAVVLPLLKKKKKDKINVIFIEKQTEHGEHVLHE